MLNCVSRQTAEYGFKLLYAGQQKPPSREKREFTFSTSLLWEKKSDFLSTRIQTIPMQVNSQVVFVVVIGRVSVLSSFENSENRVLFCFEVNIFCSPCLDMEIRKAARRTPLNFVDCTHTIIKMIKCHIKTIIYIYIYTVTALYPNKETLIITGVFGKDQNIHIRIFSEKYKFWKRQKGTNKLAP